MAAIKGFPDAQTWIFDSPILTAASEQSPDVNITRKENSHQAASGSQGVIRYSLMTLESNAALPSSVTISHANLYGL